MSDTLLESEILNIIQENDVESFKAHVESGKITFCTKIDGSFISNYVKDNDVLFQILQKSVDNYLLHNLCENIFGDSLSGVYIVE